MSKATAETKPATAVDTRVERPTKRLLALEKIVDEALESVEGAGAALREIRNGRLWRHRDYDSFEAYVTGFWQPRLSRSYANYLVEGSRVIKALREGGVAEARLPMSEASTRRLVPLMPTDEALPFEPRGPDYYRPPTEEALVDVYRTALDDADLDPEKRSRARGHQPAPPVVEQHVADKLAELGHPRRQPPPEVEAKYVLCEGGCGHRCRGTGNPQPVDLTGQPQPWFVRTPDGVYWRYDGYNKWRGVTVDGGELTRTF